MFNFFSKKLDLKAPPAEPVVDKQIIINNIAIHAMPERFRNQADKMNSAKSVGLAIIIGGVAFLIIASIALYYFLFNQPSPAAISENTQAQSDQTNTAAESGQPAETAGSATTTAEVGTLPADNNQAATSTTAEIINDIENISLMAAPDSESDGLTDMEENLLGTSTSSPDSDLDGYSDGVEFLNLYDPAGTGKLKDNPNIANYENKTFNYSLLYPKPWQQSSNGGDDSVMLKSADNQFIQIVVQPNAARQTLDQWYLEQSGATAINQADRVSGPNWQGIKNADGMTLFIMDNKQNYIFSLTYNPGESSFLEYINIYQMMIKSFSLKN